MNTVKKRGWRLGRGAIVWLCVVTLFIFAALITTVSTAIALFFVAGLITTLSILLEGEL